MNYSMLFSAMQDMIYKCVFYPIIKSGVKLYAL